MSVLNYKDINPESTQTVMLIHGLGANADSWDYQIDELLCYNYRIIIPEMRGFGQTPYNGEDMCVELMAKDCYELAQELGIQKPHLVGLSMGGAIAQRYALDYPKNLGKLILANTAAKFSSRFQRVFFYLPRYLAFKFLNIENWAKAISKIVFLNDEHQEYRDEYVRELLQVDRAGYIKTFKSLLKMDMTGEVHKIAAPTLIIGGNKDMTTPLKRQEFLHDAIPGSILTIFDAGHVTPIECAEKFNREMLAFLGNNH